MTLKEFFMQYNKVALAYSGGIDSSYLLYMAKKYNVDVRAYFVKTEFQPNFAMKDCLRFAKKVDANLKIIAQNIIDNSDIVNNGSNRCYFCKKYFMNLIYNNAKEDGYDILIDGTNFSDDEYDSPGTKALREMNILSPLKMCNITQKDVIQLSLKEGLDIENKNSYSCLATRLCEGEKITKKLLSNIEKTEAYLFSLGFRDFDLSVANNNAVITVKKDDMDNIFTYRDKIIIAMSVMFDNIYLNLNSKK